MHMRKLSTLMPDSNASASFGPTFDTLSSSRNSRRSRSVPKPNRMCASSRTTRCVNSVISLPVARQVVERRHRRFHFVAHAADVDHQLRRLFRGQSAAQEADHRTAPTASDTSPCSRRECA